MMTIEEIVFNLKKQYIFNKSIMVGDILVTDYGLLKIASIHKEPGGFVSVLDKDGNGIVNQPGDAMSVIINRNCLGT